MRPAVTVSAAPTPGARLDPGRAHLSATCTKHPPPAADVCVYAAAALEAPLELLNAAK